MGALIVYIPLRPGEEAHREFHEREVRKALRSEGYEVEQIDLEGEALGRLSRNEDLDVVSCKSCGGTGAVPREKD